MSLSPFCIFRRGESPIVAAAVHHGHDTRVRVERSLALDDGARLLEEDPFTGEWTQIAKTQIIGLRSRFEVDFNRPRDKAVYQTPEDAWGLDLWREPPDPKLVENSLAEYDAFYSAVDSLMQDLLKHHRHVVVYDLHTYNHRRDGVYAPPADPDANPEVNIGTGTMEIDYWRPVVDRLMGGLRDYDFDGRSLDVRENVRFRGGHFGKWLHTKFPRQVCAIAIEFKKFFMDEWTGECDLAQVDAIFNALQSTLTGVSDELERL